MGFGNPFKKIEKDIKKGLNRLGDEIRGKINRTGNEVRSNIESAGRHTRDEIEKIGSKVHDEMEDHAEQALTKVREGMEDLADDAEELVEDALEKLAKEASEKAIKEALDNALDVIETMAPSNFTLIFGVELALVVQGEITVSVCIPNPVAKLTELRKWADNPPSGRKQIIECIKDFGPEFLGVEAKVSGNGIAAEWDGEDKYDRIDAFLEKHGV